MIFERFVVGMLQTNCYLLGDPESKQAVVVDPGGENDRIARRLEEMGLQLAAILNTHAHFDHIMDSWTLKARAGGEIYLHPLDQPLLKDSMVGMGALAHAGKMPDVQIDRHFREGDQLTFGGIHITVIETPGHSPGHVSLHLPEAGIMLVGDTIFAGSIGRTDFLGGSYEQLISSVREKIFVLDARTRLFPGHGPETTVATEKATNPFFT